MRYRPEIYQKDIFHIPYRQLKKKGIRVLIFDLDNTLAAVEEHRTSPKVIQLFRTLQKDFKIFILSNNYPKRVSLFAKNLDVISVSFALKPLLFGYRRVRRIAHVSKDEMAMIGDQLLTDVWSAHRFGILAILVDPLSKKDLKVTSINRRIEQKIFDHYQKKKIFERGNYYE